MKELTSRKKIATIIGVAALPLAAAFSVSQGLDNSGEMDVNLANIQALAKGEVDAGPLCMYASGWCYYEEDDFKLRGTFN